MADLHQGIGVHCCCEHCELEGVCMWLNVTDQAVRDLKAAFSSFRDEVPLHVDIRCDYLIEARKDMEGKEDER